MGWTRWIARLVYNKKRINKKREKREKRKKANRSMIGK